MFPANFGGAHWGGVAYDAVRGIAIVPNNQMAAVVTLIPREKWKVMNETLTKGERVGKEFTDMQGTPYVMQRETWLSSRRSPCTAPPFGMLTAFSLKDGKTLWDVPLGTDEGLDKIGLPRLPANTGMVNLGGAFTTASRAGVHRRDPGCLCARIRCGDGPRALEIQVARGGQGHAHDLSRDRWPPVRGHRGGWRWQGLGESGFDHGLRAAEGSSLRG